MTRIMLDNNPYENNKDYTLIKKGSFYEVEDKIHPGFIQHGRTYTYRTKCSIGKQILAIVSAIFTIGLTLASNTVRQAFLGRKIIKIDAKLTDIESRRIISAQVRALPREDLENIINPIIYDDQRITTVATPQGVIALQPIYNQIIDYLAQNKIDISKIDDTDEIMEKIEQQNQELSNLIPENTRVILQCGLNNLTNFTDYEISRKLAQTEPAI